MGFSTRRAIALVALGTQGCLTGHLLDAARRREQPVAYREVFVDGDHLLLAYTALVTDDLGAPLARRERRAAIALADLRRGDRTTDAFPVVRLRDDASLPGQPVALAASDHGGRGRAPFLALERGADDRPVRFVLHAAGEDPYPPFYSAALTRTSTEAWVYPLLPLSLVVDVATDPVLLFFAPAVIVPGD